MQRKRRAGDLYVLFHLRNFSGIAASSQTTHLAQKISMPLIQTKFTSLGKAGGYQEVASERMPAMCEKCDEIGRTIERYRRLQERILDQAFFDRANELIAELEAKKTALHSE